MVSPMVQMLHGQLGGLTDWNSALKLGFDAAAEQWHPWLSSQVRLPACLPDGRILAQCSTCTDVLLPCTAS